MRYSFNQLNQLVCENCNSIISDSSQDRHSFYWIELSRYPIGMLVLTLRGQYSSFNAMEKRIALGIWKKVKEKNKPITEKKIDIINVTNIEVYNTWVEECDLIFNS